MLMKKRIMSIVIISIMLVLFVASAGAATVNQIAQWRGNGSASGRNGSEVEFNIANGKTVNINTSLKLTIDPNTSERKLTSNVYLRQKTWYGYHNLISLNLASNKPVSNPLSSPNSITLTKSGAGTTTSSGDFYFVAQTSGLTNAFYNYYTFEATY